MKRFFLLIILVFTTAIPAQAACLSQGQARQVVASGQAASLGSVRGSVRGEILKAQLCQRGGGYVYVVTVKNGSQVSTVTVNASR